MADEPNKNMDETLRAYAERRRKGADFPLHPATRRLLQGEVSRTFRGQSASPSWTRRIRAFWPQLAFGGGLCLVLGIAVLSLRQPGRNETTETQAPSKPAMNAPVDAPSREEMTPVLRPYRESEVSQGEALRENLSRDADQLAPAVIPTKKQVELRELENRQDAPLGEAQGFAESDQFAKRPAAAEAKAKDLNLQTGVAQKEAVTSLSSVSEPVPELPMFADAETAAANTAPTAPSPSLAPTRSAAPSLTKASSADRRASQPRLMRSYEALPANELSDLGAARKLRFVQVTNSPPNTRGVVPMFSSFEVEQRGTELRFLDQDGSVYSGALLTPSSDVKEELEAVGLRRLQEQQITTNAAQYYFSVRGTNVQSGKDVVLSGQYFEKTNGGQSSFGTLGVPPAQPAGRSGLPHLNARYSIIGNAVVGKSNQVPVNAISRDP